jgi:hypothetical protein
LPTIGVNVNPEQPEPALNETVPLAPWDCDERSVKDKFPDAAKLFQTEFAKALTGSAAPKNEVT